MPGGLAVKEFKRGDASIMLPPTAPGMPMFMDSPGFPVLTRDKVIRVVLPASRISNRTDFKFDAVASCVEMQSRGSYRGNLTAPFGVSFPAKYPPGIVRPAGSPSAFGSGLRHLRFAQYLVIHHRNLLAILPRYSAFDCIST